MKQKLHALLIVLISAVAYAETHNTLLTNMSGSGQNPLDEVQSSTLLKDASNDCTFSTMNLEPFSPVDVIQRLRFKFSLENGASRPLLLAFTPNNEASDGIDYGYDALSYDQFPNDMFWNIQGGNYVIQGVGAFDTSKSYPLNIIISNPENIKIGLTSMENFDSDIDVYVYDSLLAVYTLINYSDFELTLEPGNYDNRFFIAFAFTSVDALTIEEPVADTSFQISYLIDMSEVFIKSSNILDVKKVHLVNIIGQTIKTWNQKDLTFTNDEIRMPVRDVSEGAYIIIVETDTTTINKKIIIKY